MVSTTSFALGLLALTPLATAGPFKRGEDGLLCPRPVQGPDIEPAPIEYLEACIDMLRNDFGNDTCYFSIGGEEGPVFCDIGDVRIIGQVPVSGNRDMMDPSCSSVADAAQNIKDNCPKRIGSVGVQSSWGWVSIEVDYEGSSTSNDGDLTPRLSP